MIIMDSSRETEQKTDYHFQRQELMLNTRDHRCQSLQENDVSFRDLFFHDAAPCVI